MNDRAVLIDKRKRLGAGRRSLFSRERTAERPSFGPEDAIGAEVFGVDVGDILGAWLEALSGARASQSVSHVDETVLRQSISLVLESLKDDTISEAQADALLRRLAGAFVENRFEGILENTLESGLRGFAGYGGKTE